MTLLFLRESYAPTLLKRKTKCLIKETGNQDLKSQLDSGLSPKQLFMFSIVRPTKMLIFSPIVFLLSFFVAVVYGYLYLLFTTITMVFEGQYGFSQGSVGLTYLGIGIGSIIGLFAVGSMSDPILKRLTKKHGVAKPEFRLPPLIPGAMCIPVGLFWYGWTAETNQHYILPIAGTMFVGMGMITSFVCLSVVPCLYSFYHTNRPYLDDNLHLPRGRLHHPRRQRHGRQHCPPIHNWRRPTPCWPLNVRQTRSRVGKLRAGIHRASDGSTFGCDSNLWGEDKDE